MGELTDVQIADLVNRFFRNFVDGLEKIRVEPGAFGKGDVFDKVNQINQSVCKRAKGALAACDYSHAWPLATAMLEKENLEIQKLTATHNKICREILIALIKFGEIEDKESKCHSIRSAASHIGKGINLISANTGENVTRAITADPMKKAMVQMQGIFAELDKSLTVKKLRKAREQIRRDTGK